MAKMPMKKKTPKGKHMMNGRMMSDAEMERMMGKEKAKPRPKSKKRKAK